MAFLDNSGDIILDAVLTDAGRKRMAQGNFRIQKFALGDDEIDYGLYNKSAAQSSEYDIDILGTPILEAFTDNAAGLKSKLITVGGDDRLYLSVIKLYNAEASETRSDGAYYVAVNDTTKAKFNSDRKGVMTFAIVNDFGTVITLHQGIDNPSADGGDAVAADPELIENQYIIEIDNLLGTVYSKANNQATVSYIDDDNIASYFVNKSPGSDGSEYVRNLPIISTGDNNSTAIAGPRGTILEFKIKPSMTLQQQNTPWFNTLGGEVTIGLNNFAYIDTNVRVMGVTTGYRIDIPIRFLKSI